MHHPLPVQSLLAYINHKMSEMCAWSLHLQGQVPRGHKVAISG